mgnify:FL=1
MYSSADRQRQFRNRAANFSTRISARGHGFSDQLPTVKELREGDVWSAIAEIASAALVIASALESGNEERGNEARAQLNRLRGQLGLWRQRLHDPHYWDTSAAFMTVARLRLPEELFESLQAETRAVRHVDAVKAISEIDEVMRRTRTAASWRSGEIGFSGGSR